MVPTIIARDEMIAKVEIVNASRPGQVRNVVGPVRLGAPAARVLILDDHRLPEAMVTGGIGPAGVVRLNEDAPLRAGAPVVAGPGTRMVPATLPAGVRRPGAAVGRRSVARPRPGRGAVGRIERRTLTGPAGRVVRVRAGGPATGETSVVRLASETGPRTEVLGMVRAVAAVMLAIRAQIVG
ncbi:MAG: hypothetical protein ACRDRK_04270 [Pseudonocardia sp.]